MVEDPNGFDVPLRTAAAVLGVSLLGGLVSWIGKVRAGDPASLMRLVGELCTSAFAGFLCYLMCDWAGFNLRLTICLVGVAGHMGTRAITSFEAFAEKRWGAITGEQK
jgi:hypothetical protein